MKWSILHKIIILYCPVPDEEIAVKLGSKLGTPQVSCMYTILAYHLSIFWEGQAQKEGSSSCGLRHLLSWELAQNFDWKSSLPYSLYLDSSCKPLTNRTTVGWKLNWGVNAIEKFWYRTRSNESTISLSSNLQVKVNKRYFSRVMVPK